MVRSYLVRPYHQFEFFSSQLCRTCVYFTREQILAPVTRLKEGWDKILSNLLLWHGVRIKSEIRVQSQPGQQSQNQTKLVWYVLTYVPSWLDDWRLATSYCLWDLAEAEALWSENLQVGTQQAMFINPVISLSALMHKITPLITFVQHF